MRDDKERQKKKRNARSRTLSIQTNTYNLNLEWKGLKMIPVAHKDNSSVNEFSDENKS